MVSPFPFGRPQTQTQRSACWLGKPTALSPATYRRAFSSFPGSSRLDSYSFSAAGLLRQTSLSSNQTLSSVASALSAPSGISIGTVIEKAMCGRPRSARARCTSRAISSPSRFRIRTVASQESIGRSARSIRISRTQSSSLRISTAAISAGQFRSTRIFIPLPPCAG